MGVTSASGAGGEKAKIAVDKARGELRLEGVIQRNDDRPAHGEWAKKSTGFVGVKGGSEEKDFVVLLEAGRAEIYHVARAELGWKTGRRISASQARRRRGLSPKTRLEDYMTGDPVLCVLEFEREGEKIRLPLEDAVRCRVQVEGHRVEVPYAPHLVFTGAGEENRIASGCVACPSDCVGALFTDNAMPVQTESQEFRVDWARLPPPGAPVTIILRSIR